MGDDPISEDNIQNVSLDSTDDRKNLPTLSWDDLEEKDEENDTHNPNVVEVKVQSNAPKVNTPTAGVKTNLIQFFSGMTFYVHSSVGGSADRRKAIYRYLIAHFADDVEINSNLKITPKFTHVLCDSTWQPVS